MEKFESFRALHFAAILAILWLIYIAIASARGQPPAAQPPLERSIGVAFGCVCFLFHGWYLGPPQFNATQTLPLQMCHLSALAAGLYLASPQRWLVTLLYFWG